MDAARTRLDRLIYTHPLVESRVSDELTALGYTIDTSNLNLVLDELPAEVIGGLVTVVAAGAAVTPPVSSQFWGIAADLAEDAAFGVFNTVSPFKGVSPVKGYRHSLKKTVRPWRRR